VIDLPYPEAWTADGLCTQVDVGDLFFPPKGGGTRQAKAVCNGTSNRPPCPVVQQCLAYALARGETEGVWGGTSAAERRRLAAGQARRGRPLRPINHGTASGYRSHQRRGIPVCGPCAEGARLGIKVGER
jgi:WhiB family redox-sensing transcriptional regulator